ncbi:energy-coupling factor ABC transporter ATP-binding protein [Bifidobacterium stellenboschense]|uniref:ATP-binding protein of ABC transporter system n=1 Tax=Bifidobacterium stellenboschense TaxID=762211 RepID=A0A087DNS1_9BIFI|nr:energy-coupling factor ABC transporter ATP-binding protein [Bifidobacterium stellenboschense]KFI97171.1 ATP-binding protein of ABC transporter system [Bifidobacterium stellenboschense]
MGFFFSRKPAAKPASLTFTLSGAGHVYDDGHVGLNPTNLTITEKRVAIIGLNGSGKSTLLGLLDGSLTPSAGTVTITGVGTDGDPASPTLSTSSKRDLKTVDEWVGKVRREEIPNVFYRAENITQAVDESLKKHKIADAERAARIGNLFAHFGLQRMRKTKAAELDSEKRHLLAIAAALAFDPAAIVADEPSKGLDEIGTRHVAEALFTYDKQVIVATHDTDMIVRPEYAIDRTLVLDAQHVVFDGSPADAVAFYMDLIRKRYEAAKSAA